MPEPTTALVVFRIDRSQLGNVRLVSVNECGPTDVELVIGGVDPYRIAKKLLKLCSSAQLAVLDLDELKNIRRAVKPTGGADLNGQLVTVQKEFDAAWQEDFQENR